MTTPAAAAQPQPAAASQSLAVVARAPTADPESLGVPSAALLALARGLAESGLDPHALVVARHGTVVLDAAWHPYAAGAPALVYSASKTFTALAIGLLIERGDLSVGDDVGDLLGVPNPHHLTVAHLLTMSTGHSREQTLALPPRPEALLGTPPVGTPGQVFAYNSPASGTLAAIVTALTGRQVTEVLGDRVLPALGIGPRWMRADDGREQGYSGYHLTARDLEATARLLLNGGRSDSRQVVDAAFVADMVHPWADTRDPDSPVIDNGEPDTTVDDWARGYGYQVWRSRHGFRLDGAYGQFGIADPTTGITIGYQGATTDAARALALFWDLLAAVSNLPTPTDAALGDAAPGAEAARTALAEYLAAADSWDTRGLLTPAEEAAPSGVTLHDGEGPGQWVLHLPAGPAFGGGDVPVSAASWTTSVLSGGEGEQVLALATRGEGRADGSVLVHAVNTSSPHRLVVTRDAAATTARWHTVPLWHPVTGTLLVPPFVLDPTT